MSQLMRIAVMSLVVFACGRPNPEFCCVTDAQCAAAGIDELRPCAVGQACSSMNVCVAQECETSAECTSPGAPTCTNGLCVEGCSVDDDCVGVPNSPRCDTTDGACVGCISNDQCVEAAAAICDPDARQCRGCEADSDCLPGVCIEADGVCALETDVVYVSEVSGTDTGTCTQTMPCRTLGFALNLVNNVRRIIRVLGGTLTLGTTVGLTGSVIIDGTNTTVTSSVSPAFQVNGPATIEGVNIETTALRAVDVTPTGALRLFGVGVADEIQVDTGDLTIDRSTMTNTRLVCTNGGLSLRRSRVDRTAVFASDCNVSISRSHIGPANASDVEQVSAELGVVVIENSLFVENREFVTAVSLNGAGPGSQFRFNTIIQTSPIQTDTDALRCGASVTVTSNIFATNTGVPLNSQCVPNQSVFDLAGAAGAMSGTGNVTGDVTTFFEDASNGDFHLSPDSPARALGSPNLVDEDFDGVARPIPSGTSPDSGAFESP